VVAQLALRLPPRSESAATIEGRFRAFHKANPRVYAELVALARQAKKRGATRLGIAQLWEVTRWNILMETADYDAFKLNNTYRSRYARLIMEREPDLAGVFDTRRLQSA